MQISTQIDQLIQALNELKPLLTNDSEANSEKFSSVLEETLSQSTATSKSTEDNVVSAELEVISSKNKTSNIVTRKCLRYILMMHLY